MTFPFPLFPQLTKAVKQFPTITLFLSFCFITTNSLFAQTGYDIGFLNMKYDDSTGKLHLAIPKAKIDQEILYVSSLQAGIGSNDIGLDRGQLGATRIVRFEKHGNKLLLIEPNYDYRATTTNPMETKAIKEAFAESAIWGFTIDSHDNDYIYVDATSFFLRDAHGISQQLAGMREGNFKVDASRSAIYAPQTKNFPLNTEVEAIITFTGEATGQYLYTVTPSSDAVTVRLHHSFVQLPDDNYTPRMYDPRAGFIGRMWADYGTTIDSDLNKRVIMRHRLEKKNPGAALSEAIEPIIYYLDPGTPEPIRSALLEGAAWWNQAYEAAGFIDGFQIKMMPDDVDPMDVRYNIIQWVHRSTRGWSYGASVVDPRTGEIIKGKVTLGSLRVRQDYLIANGLLGAYSSTRAKEKAMELALARLRQLSAHEVGHTIGLAHNFAASTNGRASVMDYPHPYFEWKNGAIDISNAYDVGIGEWDKLAIRYGYEEIPEGVDEHSYLNEILAEADKNGLKYLSDYDARPANSSNPDAHLWDNGKNPTDELNRMIDVRSKVLANFDTDRIADFAPLSTLEEVYVPMFLMHRFQVEATAKLIGGVNYSYALKIPGEKPSTSSPVSKDLQMSALNAVLKTLDANFLNTDDHLIAMFGARVPMYGRSRESFASNVGSVFDPIAAAESAADHSLQFLLNPQRLNRLELQHAVNNNLPSASTVVNAIQEKLTTQIGTSKGRQKIIAKQLLELYLEYMNHAMHHSSTMAQTKATLASSLATLTKNLTKDYDEIQLRLLTKKLEDILYGKMKDTKPDAARIPDGSPIGMDAACGESLR